MSWWVGVGEEGSLQIFLSIKILSAERRKSVLISLVGLSSMELDSVCVSNVDQSEWQLDSQFIIITLTQRISLSILGITQKWESSRIIIKTFSFKSRTLFLLLAINNIRRVGGRLKKEFKSICWKGTSVLNLFCSRRAAAESSSGLN